MKKLVLTGIFLLPLLTGCAFLDFFRAKEPIVDLPEGKVVQIDREVLKLCEPKLLPALTQEEIDLNQFVLIEGFGKCQKKQAAGVEVIKKLGNIK